MEVQLKYLIMGQLMSNNVKILLYWKNIVWSLVSMSSSPGSIVSN